jgi:hypothetical protein
VVVGIEKMTTKALEDVVAERRRQINEEGWTAEHDDLHTADHLVKAAICYCWSAISPPHKKGAPSYWPWDLSWWKPKGRRRDLVRAAALILAEIERMDRAT